MAIRIRGATSEPFGSWVGARRKIAEVAVRAGVAAATEGFKLDLRREIAGALTARAGNMVGSKVYPAGPSLGAAGIVFARGSQADTILTAHAEGATIRGKSGLLAIPTENVPQARRPGIRGGSKPATPVEVEAMFNRDLRFVPVKGGKAKGVLVMDEVTRRKRGRGFRQATKRRRAQGRKTESVVMFVLVESVTLRRRFNPEAAAARWAARVPELIERALPEDM